MSWESWSTFLDMGGAAPFVWGSYGLALVLVVLEIFSARLRRAAVIRRLLGLGRLAAARKMQELQS